MSSFSRSAWLLLSHSMITLLSIMPLVILFFVFQYNMLTSEIPAEKLYQASLLLNIAMNGFLGIYLGSSLSLFKQHHLWVINRRYRNTLLAAFLFNIGVFSSLPIIFSFLFTGQMQLLTFLPFCVSLFSAHIVLGKTLFRRMALFSYPFILLILLYQTEIEAEPLMLLLLVATALLIKSMYRTGSYKKASKEDLMNADIFGHTALKASWVSKINYRIGLLISGWIVSTKKNIDWAIFMPQTKLMLGALLNLIILITMVALLNRDGRMPVEQLAILFVATSLLGVVMEARNLISQTKTFAHVFAGKDHSQLKKTILIRISRVLIFTSTVFLLATYVMADFFGATMNLQYLIIVFLATVFITLAMLPIFLCVTWNKASLALIAVVIFYGWSVVYVAHWLTLNLEAGLKLPEIIIFAVACLLTALFSRAVYNRRPMELLLKS
ncbi:MAG: hypothetical protein DRQ47_09325 [Gammaproteobacteria bacterium]|nr:MAG: hypothetical protein DRQ47_09325 [Gammaproteobacteria bacterium]